MDQRDGFQVHHLEEAFFPGKTLGEVGEYPVGFLQNAVETKEVGK